MPGDISVVVDGEVFAVRVGPGGRHDLDWVSGPNPGYGFTLATSSGEPLTSEQLEAAAREFLSGINPATGYLD